MTSIIILTHNQIQYTKQCLESLFKYTSQIKSAYEVIVVDNASTDGTREYLKGMEDSGKIKVIYNETNAGFPKANNQAATISKGDYICLLNNDTILTNEWLDKLLRAIKSDRSIGAVGPYTSHSSGYQQVMPPPRYRGEDELNDYANKFSNEEKYTKFLVFFCCLIRKDVWQEIGGLDEDFGIGCFEDNLFCHRLLEKGYRMKIAGNCFIHHYGSQTFGHRKDAKKLKEYSDLMARNQKIFLCKAGQYRTIALLMIISDKEKLQTINNCISSIANWVDEICVVVNYKRWPNFSRYKNITKLISRYTIPATYDYVKFTNFSAMRNKTLFMCKSEYCIWLDADDIIRHPAGIRDVIYQNPHIDVFKAKILSFTERGSIETLWHNRIFRYNKKLYWINKCHEDLTYSMNKLNYKKSTTNIEIHHYGYTHLKSWHDKNKRNLKLLQDDIKEICSKIEKSDDDKGRLAMLYYGIINSFIILASQEKNKKKKQGYLEQSIYYCDECLKLTKKEDPLTVKIWTLRGITCTDAGQDMAAKQSYQSAYDIEPLPEPAINLAESYLREKNWNKAIEILEDMIARYKGAYPVGGLSIDPVQIHRLLMEKLGHAWANKSQEARGKNKEAFDKYVENAEKYYWESIKLKPKLEIINILIQILRNTNRPDKAAQMALRAVNLWPGYFVGWNLLGEHEMLNKRFHTAKMYFRQALWYQPKLKEAKHNISMINKMLKGRR